MANAVMPDVEAITIGYLKTHTGLIATLPAAQIAGDVPANVNTAGAVTVTRVGGTPVVDVWLDRAVLDVSAWSTSKTQASLIIRTALAALHDMAGNVSARGVVTGVETVLGPRWLPDDSRTPTLARYLVSVGVTVHP